MGDGELCGHTDDLESERHGKFESCSIKRKKSKNVNQAHGIAKKNPKTEPAERFTSRILKNGGRALGVRARDSAPTLTDAIVEPVIVAKVRYQHASSSPSRGNRL
jgi:hypothetical protein